jgi:putative endonuclease
MTGLSPRQPWWRRWFGNRSERAAERFLKKQGFRIIARNVRSSAGELDLVAADGQMLVFIEVRSTERPENERPAASIDRAKQERLTRLALGYMKQHGLLGRAARFDVLTVCWPQGERRPAIQHFPSAFEPASRFQMFS